MSDIFTRNKFDIFPLVFPIEEEVEFTIKSLGVRHTLQGEYTITVHRANAGSPNETFSAWNTTSHTCKTEKDGELHFPYTANAEGEYFVRVHQNGTQIAQLHIYALEKDLSCRYPLRGDLHVHTCRSDGNEPPAIVGSTDSHSSMASNRNWDVCSTILFSRSNTRMDILDAVKEKYSVAVDTISKEYRLVGEYRLQKYAAFLMEYYFPLHNQQTLID
jgi:hypothetical protein